jgi:hypothetical protein
MAAFAALNWLSGAVCACECACACACECACVCGSMNDYSPLPSLYPVRESVRFYVCAFMCGIDS